MDKQEKDRLQNTLHPIDDIADAPQEKQETAEERRKRYMTDEERRQWSGLSEWHDPLDKPEPEPPDETGERLALASLLCGIVSVISACIHISSLLFGIAAFVCGIIAKKKYGSANKLASIGIILACICFGIALIYQFLWVLGRMFPPESVDPDTIINMPNDLASELAGE